MNQMATIASKYKSEMLIRLQEILGEDARVERFDRSISLLEKCSFSVQANGLDKIDFETLTLSLLDRLEIAIKQMAKSADNEHYEAGEDTDREKFLNLITDMLKIQMISSQEYEIALKNPKDSSLLWLLNDLRNEAEDLFSLLAIGHPEEIKEKVNMNDIESFLSDREKTVCLEEILVK